MMADLPLRLYLCLRESDRGKDWNVGLIDMAALRLDL
jgi:hypothetical protein